MAFTGMSAASAGAADKASAATTDKTTFFIDPAPFQFDRLSLSRYNSPVTLAYKIPAAIDLYATGRALRGEFRFGEGLPGNAKKAAIAAFLGDSGFYRQIQSGCCGNATNSLPDC